MQPGDTITPDSSQKKSEDSLGELKIPRGTEPQAQDITAIPKEAEPDLSVPASINEDTPVNSANVEDPEIASPWAYSEDAMTPSEQSTSLEPVVWTASEFVDHEKSMGWFMALAALTGVTVVVTYLLTREVLTAVALITAASLFGVTAKRKPRTLQYELNHEGVVIGSNFYAYNTLKSFSILDDEHFRFVQITPLKRFAMPISLYYPPEEEERVVSVLGDFLPHEKRSQDPLDRLMHKVRF